MLGLLLIACVLLHAAKSRQPDEPMYLVTVTSQTTAGSTETICAHIVPQKEPLSFMLTLEIGASSTTLLEELVTAEFHRCVKFQVPPVVTETTATIQASIKGEKTCLRKNTKILIKPSSSLTIIQTDKPIYKPGQTIKFRIVSLDSSFLLHEQMYQTVELQDPNSNRIAQWLNKSVTTGIMDLSHPTTPEAKQGIYTISAWTKRGIMTIQTFEIIEYVLPKFEVTVHLPDAIFSQDREVTVKICGKYTYGKPVLGSVKAEVCRKFPAFYGANFGHGVCVTYTMRTDKTGCATNINATSILPPDRIYQILTVECEMEEDGTGVVLKGSGSTKIVRGEIDLEFQDTPSTFKRGINYDGKIIMKGPPSSVGNKTIFLRGPQASMWTLTSDSEGVAHFSLDTSSWLEEYVHLQGRFAEHGCSFAATPCFTLIHIRTWELPSTTTILYCWPLSSSTGEREHFFANLNQGMIRWHVIARARSGILARTPGNPLLFANRVMGSLMTAVSQDLGLTSHLKDGISYLQGNVASHLLLSAVVNLAK